MRGLNLLPWREELREENIKHFSAVLLVSVIATLLVLFMIHLKFSHTLAKQGEANAYLQSKIHVLDEQIKEIKSLQKARQRLLNRMDLIMQLQTNRPQVVRFFNGLVQVMPKGLYLETITRRDNEIMMDGRADSNIPISNLMRNIERSAWFIKPTLSEIKTDKDDSVYSKKFRLQFQQKNLT
jgi:type IV pilus assembly protein PilN